MPRSRRIYGIVFTILLAVSTVPHGEVSAAQPSAEEVAGQPAFDSGAAPKTTILLAPFLTFGGRVDLEYRHEHNFDLDNSRADALSTLEPELSLAFSFDPNKYFQAFLNVELLKQFTLQEEGQDEKRPTKLRLSRAFISLKDLIEGFSLQVGRQRFKDPREWLFDENLDAVRLFYRASKFSVELSASRKGLVDLDLLADEEDEQINNYLLYATYALNKKVNIAAYTFFRDDRSPERERPIFLGLHSSGEIVHGLEHWIDLAHVRGKDGSKGIQGTGFDLGATYQFDLPVKPSITLGYAFGSGDGDSNDQTDKRFRQTDLEDNQDRFRGVTRFKYYGELLDPELSNVSILTAGLGIRPTRRSSIDFVYHYYVQDKAATRFRGADINASPSGLSKQLGSEIDLIAGYREIRNVDVKLALGYFIPGEAFPHDADNSFFAKLEMRLNF
jgi:alginate production protein